MIKEQIWQYIDEHAAVIHSAAETIGQNPELGFAEFNASKLLASILKDAGYEVTLGVGSLPTAFRAVKGSGRPNIALLCEYDALPEIGHACGHNLIGAASVGAALGLGQAVEAIGGTVTVLGAPGEETGGGKTILVKEGALDGIDAAMMFHPSSENIIMSTSNALDAFEFTFKGRTSHAAGSPEKGINALDGVIQLFNGVNALRQMVKDNVRIHGVITEGGKAANIIPDRAVAQFYVRAPRRDYLDNVVAKVLNIARGAALMTGTEVQWTNFEYSNDNMVPNAALATAWADNLQALGVTHWIEQRDGKGSSDMGNVSQVVPSLHPYLAVGQGLVGHTTEFAAACLTPQGLATTVLAAKALAGTTFDLLTEPLKLQKAKQEWTHFKNAAESAAQ